MTPTKTKMRSRLHGLLDDHNEYQVGQRSAIYREVAGYSDNGKEYIGLIGPHGAVAFILEDQTLPKELFLLDVGVAIETLGRHSTIIKTTTVSARSVPVIAIRTSELRKELQRRKSNAEPIKLDEVLVDKNDMVAWAIHEQLKKAKGKNQEVRLMVGDRTVTAANVRRDKERQDILHVINKHGASVSTIRTLTNQFPRTGEWDAVGTSPLSTDLNAAGKKLLKRIIANYGVVSDDGDHIWSIPLEPELAIRVMFGTNAKDQTPSTSNVDAVVYLSAAINSKGPYFALEQGQSGTVWLKNRPPKEKDPFYPVFPVYVRGGKVMVIPVAVPFSRLLKEVTDEAPV